MRKRFLSLALAICMVAAMLPTFVVSASALEVGQARSYYFYAYASTKNADLAGKTVADATDYSPEYERYWKYSSGRTNNIPKSQLKMDRLEVQSKNANEYMALTIEVPDDGTYSVNYKYYANPGRGCKGDVYILPYGTALGNLTNALSKGTEIASVDYSSSAEKGVVTDAEPLEETIYLTAGDHMLLFVPTAEGDNATSYTYYTYPNSLTLTLTEKAPAEDEELTEAFNLDDKKDNHPYTAPSVTGITEDGLIEAGKNADGSYNLTAPATKEGEPFLYWAMGMKENKRIVSFEETLKNYVPEGNGVNYLVAVYEGDVDTTVEEYYNRNGQRIATRKAGEEEPAKPSMAGYGEAKSWVNVEGTNVWYAEYEKTTPGYVTVTVDGDEQTVPYGTKITCTADPEEENFKCWTKSDIYGATDAKPEIVSVDETYEFCAWEDCTVTAEYEEHTPISKAMKIIIDDFAVGSETGVMAEFINIDAVEKGIMFTDKETEETTKIAMTTTDNQFTVVADKPGTYVGYAILAGGNPFTLITDGLYEHN